MSIYIYIYTYNYAFSSSEEGALKDAFLGPGYFHSKDVAAWLWHFLANIFICVYYKLIIDNDKEITTLNLLLQVSRDQNPQEVICKYWNWKLIINRLFYYWLKEICSHDGILL